MTMVGWEERSTPPALAEREVHVWRARMGFGPTVLERLSGLLADDEIKRANRFHFPQDRERYITARGVLRELLGEYSGVPAEEIQFTYSSRGKPSLAQDNRTPRVSFNVSHSGTVALLAFTVESTVGVDVEHMDRQIQDAAIAEMYFSATEVSTLQSLPRADRREAFFNCWTRKEAFVKALGEGLSTPLDSFVVSMAPGERAAILRIEGDPEAAGRWSLHALDPETNYAAAVCVAGNPTTCQRLAYRPQDRTA